MKIKVLKIRNIASIEHGDIDFENGLRDPVSGQPASLFLIDGDTGAGKSVILDCISMALYATTPRIENASGKKNNSFDDQAGNNIKISDITQYTRLGISSKDDCYAELSFLGNDGREYVARYELGVTRNGTYRKTLWTLLLDDATMLNKNGDIREAISVAVGLSFEQFSRMAMLAQGQFATFLTGGKEERERILEQLTNTELFSTYGEAIKRIFTRKKQAHELISAEYEKECKRLMSDEEVAEATAELERTLKEEKSFKSRSDALAKRMSDMAQLVKEKAERETTVKKLESLRAREESEEFKGFVSLVSQWDSTASEREKLSLRQRSVLHLDDARAAMEAGKERFRQLFSDLLFRSERLKARRKAFAALSEQLDARSGNAVIYGQASGIMENMKMLSGMREEIAKAVNEETADKERLPGLGKSFEEASKQAGESAEKLRLHQESIDDAIKERDDMHPDVILSEISACNELGGQLAELARLISELQKNRGEERLMAEEISRIKGNVEVMRGEANAASNRYAEVRDALETARSRHLTMHQSVEEGLRNLRKRMVEEHTEVCPLCGSHIESLTLDEEEFNEILDPLKKEVDNLRQSLEESQKALDARKSALDMEVGKLKEKEKSLEALRKEFKSTEKTVSVSADKLGIVVSEVAAGELEKSVAEAVAANKVENERLAAKYAETEKLNKRISALLNERKSLDKVKLNDEKTLRLAKEELDRCRQKLSMTSEQIVAMRKKSEALALSLGRIIGNAYPDWEKDIPAAAVAIRKDAEEYNAILAKRDAELNGIGNSEKELSDIRTTMQDVAAFGKFPEEQAEAADAGLPDVRSAWNVLLADVRSAASFEATAVKEIREYDEVLTRYYTDHSANEESLRRLMESADAAVAARDAVTSLRSDVKSLEDAAERLRLSMESLMAGLAADGDDEFPSQESLAEEKGKVDSEHSALIERAALLAAKLKGNEECRKETKELERKMEVSRKDFETWNKMYGYFGGTRFRTLVQSHILRPLLNNANVYLERITDHYRLTCSDSNEQLSILVHDRYNKDSLRSVTVLSGGERFMISLSLSLALSSMNKADMNVDILFIDEGFGTLDVASLNAVMSTLRRLPEIAGQNGRRVGVISHREELAEEIDVRVSVRKKGEGRSFIEIN